VSRNQIIEVILQGRRPQLLLYRFQAAMSQCGQVCTVGFEQLQYLMHVFTRRKAGYLTGQFVTIFTSHLDTTPLSHHVQLSVRSARSGSAEARAASSPSNAHVYQCYVEQHLGNKLMPECRRNVLIVGLLFARHHHAALFDKRSSALRVAGRAYVGCNCVPRRLQGFRPVAETVIVR
jgi:hypothetical protein